VQLLTFFNTPEVLDRFLCPQGAPQNGSPRAPFPTGTKIEQKNLFFAPPWGAVEEQPQVGRQKCYLQNEEARQQGGAFGAALKGAALHTAPIGGS